jgi:hypothetical protein
MFRKYWAIAIILILVIGLGLAFLLPQIFSNTRVITVIDGKFTVEKFGDYNYTFYYLTPFFDQNLGVIRGGDVIIERQDGSQQSFSLRTNNTQKYYEIEFTVTEFTMTYCILVVKHNNDLGDFVKILTVEVVALIILISAAIIFRPKKIGDNSDFQHPVISIKRAYSFKLH